MAEPPAKRQATGGACAKVQAGSVSLHKKCEDCALTMPSFGMEGDHDRKARRWCSGCAEGHPGSKCLSNHKMCEGCKSKHPSFGIKGDGPDDGKIRWCLGCSKNHKDAVRLSKAHKMCEKCNNKTSTFGIPAEANGDGKRRWCGACAKGQPGAVSLIKRTGGAKKVVATKMEVVTATATATATAAAMTVTTDSQCDNEARMLSALSDHELLAEVSKRIRRRRKCKQLAAVRVVDAHLGQVQVTLPGGASVEATFVGFNHGTGQAVAVYHSDGVDGAIAMPMGLLSKNHRTWAKHLKHRSQKINRHAVTVVGGKTKPFLAAADFAGNGEQVTILPATSAAKGPSLKGFSCDKVRFFPINPGATL